MRKEVGRKWYKLIGLISSYSHCIVLLPRKNMRIVITLAEEVKLTMVEKQRGTEKRSRRKHDETLHKKRRQKYLRW